jgi:hypothetical protein
MEGAMQSTNRWDEEWTPGQPDPTDPGPAERARIRLRIRAERVRKLAGLGGGIPSASPSIGASRIYHYGGPFVQEMEEPR